MSELTTEQLQDFERQIASPSISRGHAIGIAAKLLARTAELQAEPTYKIRQEQAEEIAELEERVRDRTDCIYTERKMADDYKADNLRLREQIKLIASKEESLAADNLRLREKLKAVGRGGGDFGGARG